MEFSRCTQAGGPPYREEPSPEGTVSQNSTAYGQLRRGRRYFQANRGIGRSSSRGTTSTSSAPAGVNRSCIPRKEVIQPQLPLRLPCYDFTPIINPTFDGCLPKRVSPPASGIANFRGVTGGVYKARERIHRDVADSRLLATPPSWRRVSASNPNRDRLFGIRSASRHRSPLYRPM
jgi:hypothetical protein